MEEVDDDVCPVCRSSRRTSPGLRFKISPKCYHRICEGCVDRIFASGKAECPIINCHKQLWKREWRVQTFEDLAIEREVDLRKRVMKILNRNEEEFETKLDWDNFLEQREEMIMNLVLGTDVAATNRKLKEYEEANLKSPKARSDTDPTGLLHGLKKMKAIPIRARYDPFMGMSTNKDYYHLRDGYSSLKYDKEMSRVTTIAGGYDFQQFWDESLLRAFAGLGCFIEDEKAPKGVAAVGILVEPLTIKDSNDVF